MIETILLSSNSGGERMLAGAITAIIAVSVYTIISFSIKSSKKRKTDITLQKRPNDPNALYSKAIVFNNAGKMQEAISCLEKARIGDPVSQKVSLFLGYLYYKRKDYALAKPLFDDTFKNEERCGEFIQEAVKTQSKFFAALYHAYGHLYHIEGDLVRANNYKSIACTIDSALKKSDLY